jgi:phosphoglycolate phosphatase-like HAD superfamily hydrolase
LGRFGLEGYFDTIKTASNSTPKPSPDGLLQIMGEWGLEPLEIAFVGDSKVDETAALAAGVPFWSFKNDTLAAELHLPSFNRLHNWMLEYASGHNISPIVSAGGF